VLAWAQIEAALAAEVPRGVVLADAGYGDEAAFRDRLEAHGLSYAVGIRQATKVWWAAPSASQARRGSPTDQRARSGSCTARQELPHRHLA